MPSTIYIRGIPENKMIKEVNVRSGPGINTTVSFRVAIDTTATCVEVKPDPGGDKFQGQVYRWFNLTFSDGRAGWIRDDLLDLQGDFTAFGYTTFTNRTYAFAAAGLLARTVVGSDQSATTVTVTQPTNPTQPTTVTVTQPATAQTDTPAVTVTVSQPSAPDVKVTVTPASSTCTACVRPDSSANVRFAPSIFASKVDAFPAGMSFPVLGVEQGQDGQPFRWIRLTTSSGGTGYIREDLLTFSGECAALGLTSTPVITPVDTSTSTSTTLNTQNKFASPIKTTCGIFQEYGDTRFGSPHKGTDLSFPAKEGTPIYACGNGVVAYIMRCTRCTDAAPNFRSQGLGDWNAQAIRDPAWGFGFGNHVVIRYAWADLPGSMRDTMAAQNLTGGYAYVVHAHLSRIDVTDGASVSAGTQLGLLGNTGNSTGAHLHLEIRLSLSPNEKDIFNRIVVNPRVMYDL